ncbi:MAG: TetR family transcriptional regulator [Aquisalimonadaceae bacterium]
MVNERDAIVDAALALAEEQAWEQVRLYRVAERLGIPLQAVSGHFREKEDIADAWFDRADAAMLEAAESGLLSGLNTVDRLEHLIFIWLGTLAPHRKVTSQMIRNKLEPGHLHVQIPAVLRISRTVQWLRETAHRDAHGIYRGLEETVLSAIFVSTFVYWLGDSSKRHQRTRAGLRRALGAASRLSRWLPGHAGGHGHPHGALPRPQAMTRVQ